MIERRRTTERRTPLESETVAPLHVRETNPVKQSFLREVAERCGNPLPIEFDPPESPTEQHTISPSGTTESVGTTEAVKRLIYKGTQMMVDNLGSDGWNAEAMRRMGLKPSERNKTLSELVDIPQLQRDLVTVRERYPQDLDRISEVEKAVAGRIQAVAGKIPYKGGNATPEQVLKDQQVNCVSQTAIQEILFKEAGLRRNVVAKIPGHTLPLQVTSDKKVYWRDSRFPERNMELTDADMQGVKGTTVTIADIVALADDPTHQDLVAHGATDALRSRVRMYVAHPQDPTNHLILTHPRQGILSNMFEHIGDQLKKSGSNKEALTAYAEGQAIDFQNPLFYERQAGILANSGRLSEALMKVEQLGALGVADVIYFDNLRNVLNKMGRHKEALVASEKALALWPTNAYLLEIVKRSQRNLEVIPF
jgi:tetratricopeptide (TPR) repeat protein